MLGHDVELGQHIIRQYEQNQIKRYRNKLILLRFSGFILPNQYLKIIYIEIMLQRL